MDKQVILNEIAKHRKIGEHAGGSDHLSFVSITKLDIKDPKQITHDQKPAFEVIFTIETYTETEFMHHPKDDHYYKGKYTY